MNVKKVVHPKFIFLITMLLCLELLIPASALGTSTELQIEKVCPAGEPIAVDYSGSIEGSWLGVYPAGGLQEEMLIQKIVLPETEDGSGSAEVRPLPVGEYQLAFYRESSTPAIIKDFVVTEGAFYMDRVSYERGSEGKLTVHGDGASADAWIGVYSKGTVPGTNTCLFWEYLRDCDLSEAIDLNRLDPLDSFSWLSPGEYVVYLFEGDNYVIEDSFEFSIVDNTVTRAVYVAAGDTAPTSMEGFIIITPCTDKYDYYYLVWADENGTPIAGYSPLGTLEYEDGKSMAMWMPDNIAAPTGATQIVVYPGTETIYWKSKALASIELAPAAIGSQEAAYSFAVLSDIHITQSAYYIYNRNFTRAIRDVIKNMPGIDAIIYPGDVTNNGDAGEFSVLSGLLSQFQKQLPDQYLLMGNHDLGLNRRNWSQQVDLFAEYTDMPNYYYSFELNGTTFICLGSDDATGIGDSVSAVIGQDQLDWLEGRLKQAAAEDPDMPIFVFIHQPLYDTLVGTSTSIIEGDDELREILDQYPQAIVISGHSHNALNRYYTVYDGEGEGASMIHAGSVSALWDNTAVGSGPDDSGASYDGSQGILVEVCEDYIRVRSRNFKTGEWMGDAERIIWFHR